jgi:hypothetical protein
MLTHRIRIGCAQPQSYTDVVLGRRWPHTLGNMFFSGGWITVFYGREGRYSVDIFQKQGSLTFQSVFPGLQLSLLTCKQTSAFLAYHLAYCLTAVMRCQRYKQAHK